MIKKPVMRGVYIQLSFSYMDFKDGYRVRDKRKTKGQRSSELVRNKLNCKVEQ